MKFTSEDLLKAMGLKVNDVFYIGLSKNKAKLIIFENKFYYTYIGDEMFRKYHIEELIDMDIEIIQPKPTLTEDEKVILKNTIQGMKWLARDKGSIYTVAFINKPIQCIGKKDWRSNSSGITLYFPKLFQFVKWEDEPYSIEELLKE